MVSAATTPLTPTNVMLSRALRELHQDSRAVGAQIGSLHDLALGAGAGSASSMLSLRFEPAFGRAFGH